MLKTKPGFLFENRWRRDASGLCNIFFMADKYARPISPLLVYNNYQDL